MSRKIKCPDCGDVLGEFSRQGIPRTSFSRGNGRSKRECVWMNKTATITCCGVMRIYQFESGRGVFSMTLVEWASCFA